MKEKKQNKKIIILVLVIAFMIYVLPFLFVLGVSFLIDEELDYTYKDKIINIPKKEMQVEILNNYYDSESKCYKIDTKANNKLEKKSLFSGDYVDIEFDFYDKDGYLIGTSYLSFEELDKNTKHKKTVSYCEDFSNEIETFKVSKVNKY